TLSNGCASVSITANHTKICFVVNKKANTPPPAKPGKLIVIKKTVNGNGTFSFTGDAGDFSIMTHWGSGSKTISNLTPGTYSVSENTPDGWQETSSNCDGVVVTAGHTSKCTIVNTKNHSHDHGDGGDGDQGGCDQDNQGGDDVNPDHQQNDD